MRPSNGILALITAAALLLWMAAGSYLFSKTCCDEFNLGTTSEQATLGQSSQLLIKDGGAFYTKASTTVLFNPNSAKPVVVEDVSKSIFEMIEYIKSHPLKKVIITGYVAKQEEKGIELAKERAKAVQDIFIQSATPTYQVEIKSRATDNLKRNENYVVGMVDFEFEPIAPLVVKDEIHSFEANFLDNFAYKKSSFNFVMPLSQDIKMNFRKIANYLKARRDRKLLIKGYYNSEEKNTSGLPNLGLVRANKIKMLLSSLGAPENQMELAGEERATLQPIESKLYGTFVPAAIDFQFNKMTIAYKRYLEKERKRIEEDFEQSKVFRFKDFGPEEHKIVRDVDLRNYLNDLILYLSINQRAKIYCIGHSNRTRDDKLNYSKGYERAEFVKKFLSGHGIHPDRIVVKSEGAKRPLGSEKTLFGQYYNRRVDLYVSVDGEYDDIYKRKKKEKDSKKEKKDTAKTEVKPDTTQKDTVDKITPTTDSVETTTTVTESDSL